MLCEPFGHQTGFVAVDRAQGSGFEMKDPFTANDVHVARSRNKCPSIVVK